LAECGKNAINSGHYADLAAGQHMNSTQTNNANHSGLYIVSAAGQRMHSEQHKIIVYHNNFFFRTAIQQGCHQEQVFNFQDSKYPILETMVCFYLPGNVCLSVRNESQSVCNEFQSVRNEFHA
jgi:hypothetical protein